MHIIGDGLLLLTALGAVQAVGGLLAVRAFVGRPHRTPARRPPVSVLKPVCGDEPHLEEALESFCLLDYPDYQIIIGAEDAADPALATARRVQARFPHVDMTIIADPTWHGVNRKIGNLMNMLPLAAHDVLVVADSDLHVRPDYLSQVMAALERPGTGLVTTVAAGEAAVRGVAARLGALHMSHHFLPSALIAVALGRQDCLGGTMALRRDTLMRVGGLAALVDHVADDYLLGCLVRRLGLAVRVADTVPVITVQERTVRALWLHELRWARTIRVITPVIFANTLMQYPLVWSLLWVLLSGAGHSAVLCFVCTWAIRAAVLYGIEDTLRGVRARPPRMAPVWLLPARDLLSAAEVLASYFNDAVVWRGQVMHADTGLALEDEVEEADAFV